MRVECWGRNIRANSIACFHGQSTALFENTRIMKMKSWISITDVEKKTMDRRKWSRQSHNHVFQCVHPMLPEPGSMIRHRDIVMYCLKIRSYFISSMYIDSIDPGSVQFDNTQLAKPRVQIELRSFSLGKTTIDDI